MSEGQGTTAVSTGTQGNAPNQPASATAGVQAERVRGQPEPVQRAIGVTPSEAPESKGEEKLVSQGEEIVKLNIRGKEQAFNLRDPEDREKLTRIAQKAEAADENFRSAAEIKKQAQAYFAALKANPLQVLEAMGHNVSDLAKGRIAEELRLMQMDPLERRAMEAEQRAQAYENQEQTRQQQLMEQQQNAEKEAYAAQHRQKWQTQIIDALEKEADLPKNPYSVARMAQYIRDAKSNGYPDVTATEAARAVKGDMIEEFKALVGSMPIDKVVKHFGKEFVDKVRQHSIEEMQKPLKQEFGKPPSKEVQDTRNPQNRKWKSWNEYQEILEKRV